MEGLIGLVMGIGAVVTVLFLILRVKKGGLPAMFTKAAASACFIGTAFVAYAYNIEKHGYTKERFEYGVLMLLGFIFSLLGDIWLDLKYVHKESSRPYTYAGFISFMIGHTFFIPAILLGYDDYKWWFAPLILGSCLVFTIVAALMEKINKNLDYGEYRPITLVYAMFVAGTMFCAINKLILFGYSTKYLLLTIGAIAFVLSDLVLSSIYFEKGKNTKGYVLVNHILYYLAQFMFASTLLMGAN